VQNFVGLSMTTNFFTSLSIKSASNLRKISSYNEEIYARFPELECNERNSDVLALPSNSCGTANATLAEAWGRVEAELRVGIGHELLQEIRNYACLHHYITRKKQKDSRGNKQMEAVAKQQSTVASKKAVLVGKYISNWRQITAIFNVMPCLQSQKESILKGLQRLDREEDVKFFEEWGSQTGSYTTHSSLNISWIWRVAMEGRQPSQFSGAQLSELQKLTNSWESEGKCSLFSKMIATYRSSARRLEWVHCFSRNERWKEEVILVKEELRRVGAWFINKIQMLKQRKGRTQLIGDSWTGRGYMSLLSTRIFESEELYQSLPFDAKVSAF
jgi:hypothetical protein